MTFSELEQLFKARRSIRKYQDKPVPEELIIKAVEAAALSPNSGGKQPYQCYVITDAAKIAPSAMPSRKSAIIWLRCRRQEWIKRQWPAGSKTRPFSVTHRC